MPINTAIKANANSRQVNVRDVLDLCDLIFQPPCESTILCMLVLDCKQHGHEKQLLCEVGCDPVSSHTVLRELTGGYNSTVRFTRGRIPGGRIIERDNLGSLVDVQVHNIHAIYLERLAIQFTPKGTYAEYMQEISRLPSLLDKMGRIQVGGRRKIRPYRKKKTEKQVAGSPLMSVYEFIKAYKSIGFPRLANERHRLPAIATAGIGAVVLYLYQMQSNAKKGDYITYTEKPHGASKITGIQAQLPMMLTSLNNGRYSANLPCTSTFKLDELKDLMSPVTDARIEMMDYVQHDLISANLPHSYQNYHAAISKLKETLCKKQRTILPSGNGNVDRVYQIG